MLHLAAEEARNRKFSILFIDWEVQYRATIDHVAAMRERYVECTEQFYHVCLPMTTVNGVSVIQPEWTAWEPGVSWVRQPPEWAITDEGYFPFYRSGMTFESFVPAFNAWFSRGERAAIMVGIRADESLNRFLSISSRRKLRLSPDKPWTTRQPDGSSYAVYPLYDWHVRDIWRYHARSGLPCNSVYDLMFRAGVICPRCGYVSPSVLSSVRGCGYIIFSSRKLGVWPACAPAGLVMSGTGGIILVATRLINRRIIPYLAELCSFFVVRDAASGG